MDVGHSNAFRAAQAAWEPASRPHDLAGRFRFGLLLDDRPHILTTWQVVTSNDQVASHIAGLLGGEPRTSRDAGRGIYEVTTGMAVVDVILAGPAAVEVAMVLGDGDKVLATCDGRTRRSEEGQRPCECPVTFAARRRLAGDGRGCEPSTRIYFSLACCPALGSFVFSSGSWSFAEQAAGLASVLTRSGGPAQARLGLERTTWRASTAGEVCYTRPTLAIVRRP
jgi:hypothetical protein